MMNRFQNSGVNENRAQESNDENVQFDVSNAYVPKITDKMVKELHSIDTNEKEWPLHSKEIPDIIQKLCGNNKDRLECRPPHYVSLQQVQKIAKSNPEFRCRKISGYHRSRIICINKLQTSLPSISHTYTLHSGTWSQFDSFE